MMTIESAPSDDLRMDGGALMGALWSRALRIVIVTLLLVGATYAVLLFVPKQYESSASLLVEDRSNTYNQAAGAATSTTGSSVSIDALMSSQIELIKSRDTLLAVVDQLNLRSVAEFNGSGANPVTMLLSLIGRKPEPKSVDEAVLQNLNDRLTVIRERDSAVISIFVRSADPQLAAKLANAIAAEHVKRRAGQSVSDIADASASLQQQIDALAAKVQDDDTKVADYKAQNGIFAGSNGTTLPDQQISDVGKQITDAQAARNSAQEHATLIRSLLKSGASTEGVDDVRNSAVVQSLMQNRATLQSTLAEKLATLLPAHPTIRALNAQIAQVNAQIGAEARRIADGLDAQVTVQDGIIASLNDDLTRAKLAASAQTKNSVTLDSLVAIATADRELLAALYAKHRDAAGRTDSGSVLPDVRIITQAAPSVVPASPKTALILGAVGFVALALQIGMVLFGELMSGRAVYDRGAVRRVATEPALETVPDADAALYSETIPDAPEPDLFATPEPDLVHDSMHAAVDEEHAGPAHEDDIDVASPIAAVAPRPPAPSASTPQPQPPHIAAGEGELALANLIADVRLVHIRVVLLAAIGDARDAAVVADRLVSEALQAGLSVCRIDAGSMRAGPTPGLSDLCAEAASFGDVVHKVSEGLAEVPWGTLPALDRRSTKPLTLLEALADIYEIVIVATGRVGMSSSLQLFAGARGRVVMVSPAATPASVAQAMADDAASLGFEAVDTMPLERQSEVA